MLFTVLALGLIAGMQHAFEADHVAAVSALVSGRSDRWEMTRRGVVWGLGHTIALLLVSGGVLVLGWSLPASFDVLLEGFVGVLLILLGARVLLRLRLSAWPQRARDLGRRQGKTNDGAVATATAEMLEPSVGSSRGIPRNRQNPHMTQDTESARNASWPTLFVGLTHGAAGSGALLVVVAASLATPVLGLAYVTIFGVGSILGMALLTALISLPLGATVRHGRSDLALRATIGLASLLIGCRLLWLQLAL